MISVGVKPTNAKIIEMFGYGLDVFDVANCANQGLIESLSAMRPADRKRMVETVIGLDSLTKLIETCRQEANMLSREAEALARGVGEEPQPPEKPQDERPVSELRQACEQARQDAFKLGRARADLSAPEPPRPDENPPIVPGLTQPEESYRQAVADYDEARRAHASVQVQLNAALQHPVSTLSASELSQLEALIEAREFVERHPQPRFTEADLVGMERQHEEAEACERWHRLAKQGEHECPACQHRWPVAGEEMVKLGDWQDRQAPRPKLNRGEIAAERGVIRNYEKHHEVFEKAAVLLFEADTNPKSWHGWDRPMLRQEKEAWRMRTILADLQLQAEGRSKDMKRLAPLVHEWDQHQEALRDFEQWRAMNATWADWRMKVHEAEQVVAELGHVDQELPTLENALMAAQLYEREHTAWMQRMAAYAERRKEMDSLRETASAWREAVEAINEVRAQVEATLVPGLSALASLLVQRMTNGARRTVEVDQGFTLRCDGQEVDTLSGSEKAAVNLALRIALGRMLTNRVFSVLILDEPDAAMDDQRAQATADCLRSLSGEIKQVFLVTHKNVEADHVVRLN